MNVVRFKMADGGLVAVARITERDGKSLLYTLFKLANPKNWASHTTYTPFHHRVLARQGLLPLMRRDEATKDVLDAVDSEADWFVVSTSLKSVQAPWSRGLPWRPSAPEPGMPGLVLPGSLCLERAYRAVARDVFNRGRGGMRRFFAALAGLQSISTAQDLANQLVAAILRGEEPEALKLLDTEESRLRAQALVLRELSAMRAGC